jgi:hypothetical protein
MGPNDFLITIRYRTTFSKWWRIILAWSLFDIKRNCRENKFARHRTSVPIMYGIVAHGLTDPQRSTYVFYWWGILPRRERSWWTSFIGSTLTWILSLFPLEGHLSNDNHHDISQHLLQPVSCLSRHLNSLRRGFTYHLPSFSSSSLFLGIAPTLEALWTFSGSFGKHVTLSWQSTTGWNEQTGSSDQGD